MAGLVLFAYVVVIVIAVGVVWVVSQRAGRVFAFRPGGDALGVAVRFAKRRFLVAGAATAVVLLAGFIGAATFPAALGLPLAVAPGLAGAAGLALYAATPPPKHPVGEDGTRAASLEPRRSWSFAPWRVLSLLAVLFGATFVLLLVTSVTSSPDEAGRYREVTFSDATFVSSSGPYPGWFYALPLIATLVLLLAAALLAARRIAVTPSLPGAGLDRQDRSWRIASTRVVTTLVAACVSLQFGGVAVFGGNAIHNAAFHPGVSTATQITGDLLFVLGIAALVASIVWFTLAVLRAFGLPHAVAHHAATAHIATGRVSP